MEKKVRRISISTLLDPEDLTVLDEICKEEEKSLSQVVREAVEQFIKTKGER